MTRTLTTAFSLLLALALPASQPAYAALMAVEGDARDPDTDRLLYRETHLIRGEGERLLERIVLYRCPNGTAFARKRVDYRSSSLAPDFELIDVRGYREGLRREGSKTLTWSGEGTPTPLRATNAALVADAGFDEFVRQRWPQLTAGKAQPLAFAVPAFGRSLPFKIRSAGARVESGQRVHAFELRVDNLLGMVVSAIRVDYDADDRRLRRFIGPTNIRDARGDQIKARIDFPQAPQPVDTQRWQAAAQQSLAVCKLGR